MVTLFLWIPSTLSPPSAKCRSSSCGHRCVGDDDHTLCHMHDAPHPEEYSTFLWDHPPLNSRLACGFVPSSPALLLGALRLPFPLRVALGFGLSDIQVIEPTPLVSFLFFAILILILQHLGDPPKSVVIEIFQVYSVSHH